MAGIVLALGGGGVRGAAHTAVLDVLRENQIPIVGLAGSSAGAVAAASFAFGLPVRHTDVNEWLKDPEIERLLKNNTLNQVIRMVEFVRKPYLAEGTKIRQGYRTLFGEQRIEDAPIPLIIQATDFNTGELVLLRAGPIAEALSASSAVPSVFPPVQWHGRTLVDGDVAEKVPVTAAKSLGLGPVIAIDISNVYAPADPKSAFEAAMQAGEASRRRLLSLALAQADLTISMAFDPPVDTFDHNKAEYAYEQGRLRAEAALPAIARLIEEPLVALEPWWSRFLQPTRQPRKRHPKPNQPENHQPEGKAPQPQAPSK